MVEIVVDFAVRHKFPEVYLSSREVEVEVRPSRGLEEHVSQLRSKFTYTLENLRKNPIVRAYRDFYWRIGIDPTKQRPASEALARRILSGSGLPPINNVVDAGNLASAETLIPIGLYDLDKVSGELVLRFAKPGEQFIDITGKVKKLDPNVIVLADDQGLIHVFPHRDSTRTMITWETKRVLIVGCGVPGVPKELVDHATALVIHYLEVL